MDADGLGREERLDAFGPLDEAPRGTLEIVFGANVEGFGKGADAVEVEVVDEVIGVAADILVDDGEGGAVDGVADTEGFAEGLDEGGLAGAHLAVEGYDTGRGADGAEELLGRVVEVGQRGDVNRAHLGCRVMKGTIISSIEIPPCWKVPR